MEKISKKPSNSRRKPKSPWSALTATEIGLIWGITKQAVGLWHSKDRCPRNRDGTYDLAKVIAWREAKIGAKAEAAQEGGDSPALERKRAADARLAEIKIEREERKLIPRDEVHEMLVHFASILRSTGDALQRNHGIAAQGVLNEGIDLFKAEVIRRLG